MKAGLKTIEYFKSMMLKGGYKRICNSANWIKLRPNDQEKFLGEENYSNYVKAFEEILNEYYSNDKLKDYYNIYNRDVDGWMDFQRWLKFKNNK